MTERTDDIEKRLRELLHQTKETEWVEFKQAKRNFDFDDLGKYFSALSNEANLKHQPFGWMVFGVDNMRNIVGTDYRLNRSHLENLKFEIANQTSNRITYVEIHEKNLPEGRVIIFQIPCAPKGLPVAWKGHWYGRDGESLVPLNLQELEQIRDQAQH